MSKSKDKKVPLYKNIWFWDAIIAVVAIIVVAIIAIVTGSKPAPEPEKTTPSEPQPVAKQEPIKPLEGKVGESFYYHGAWVSVVSVERNYSDAENYIYPREGKELIKATVNIANGNSGTYPYNVMYWRVEDSNGAITDSSAETYSLPNALNSGELTKNGKVTGDIIFEIPAGDSPKLHYQITNIYIKDEVIINL